MSTENLTPPPGLSLLRRPLLPLTRLVQLLFMTGPFSSIQELLAELTEPVETASVTYEQPAILLESCQDILKPVELLKQPAETTWEVRSETDQPLDFLEQLDLLITQQILTRELEEINSLLCAPCGCTLCCTGPGTDQNQEFFEIPLRDDEISLFPLNKIDTPASRQTTAMAEPPLTINTRPFYAGETALYHWQTGWSMILTRNTRCPSLDPDSSACRIYDQRPETCRHPQIFPYAIERAPSQPDPSTAVYYRRRKLLAIWDCPYVRRFKDEIAAYAELCELEPVFRENKN